MKDGKAVKDTCRLVGERAVIVVVVGVAVEEKKVFLGLFKAMTASDAFFTPSADGFK